MSVVSSPSNMLNWLIASGPSGWSGRTSPASSVLTGAGPSLPSSVLYRERLLKCLKEGGAILALSKLQGLATGWRGECLTLSLPEYHSAGAASSLSDILETTVLPPRYFLSASACRGILRRAAKRGKELPPLLRGALEAAAATLPTEDRKTTKTS